MSNSENKMSLRRRAFIPKEECPMALAAMVLGDKWTLLILREAFYGVLRYDDMRQDLGVPRSVLTDRLNKLVKQGIMKRFPYKEDGERTRFAYALTDAGQSLALTFMALSQWGEEHLLKSPAPVQITNKRTGTPLRVELMDVKGETVAPTSAKLGKRSP